MTSSNARKAISRAAHLMGILWVMSVPYAVFGQAVSQISGTVKDNSGAVMAGVQITATETDTDFKRTALSDDAGNYVLTNLPLGPYRLEASKMGFRSYVQTGIVLQVGTAPEIPITMGLGQVSESVQVEANVSQVETRSIGVGSVIETQRILDLPLNGRQPTDLITLGGSSVQTGVSPGYGMRTGALISVAGSSIEGVQYNFDGAPHINTLDGSGVPLPFPDALQEFRVSTSAQDASNSGHSGATVNSVTKSGSNAFHGDLFEFLRNYDANARDFFATGPDGLKRNQFGGTVGGPIKKDKLFFFAGYQGTLVRSNPPTTVNTVATQDMLNGNFTAFASAACQGTNKTLGAPFVNNQVPASLLNQQALNFLKHVPVSTNPCGTIQYGIPNNNREHQILGRIDDQLSEKHQFFGRYFIANYNNPVLYNPANVLTANKTGVADQSQSFVLGDSYTFTPTVIASFHGTLNRTRGLRVVPNYFSPTDLGVQLVSQIPGFMGISVGSGTGGFSLGGGATNPGYFNSTDFQLAEDVNVIRGSHQISFGVNYIH